MPACPNGPCSSQPWQVDGVLGKMIADGFSRDRLLPIENKTVVTNPREGCRNNRWEPVLARHGVTFTPLPEVEWQVYRFTSPLLKLNDIFPEGIQIPAIYPGRQILHLGWSRASRRPGVEVPFADSVCRSVRIDVREAPGHLEQRGHFVAAFGHHQRMRLARRLEDVAALVRNPVVLQIVPAAAQDEAVDWGGVAVAAQHAGLPDPQQVDPVALSGVKA